MIELSSPALRMLLDDAGNLTFFGIPDGENRLNTPISFVTLNTGHDTMTPVSLSDSEGYLCFRFADGSLFYLLPAVADCGIALDTAGFFPSETLTDVLCDDLSGCSIRFGLESTLPGTVGADVSNALPALCGTALPEEGFMGAKLALTICDNADTAAIVTALIWNFA